MDTGAHLQRLVSLNAGRPPPTPPGRVLGTAPSPCAPEGKPLALAHRLRGRAAEPGGVCPGLTGLGVGDDPHVAGPHREVGYLLHLPAAEGR